MEKRGEQLKFTVCIEHQFWSVCVLGEEVVVWSSVYSMSLSFVIHKNRKIKALEGVGGAWRHTDACVTSCSKASGFLTTAHQGIQAKLKHSCGRDMPSKQCNDTVFFFSVQVTFHKSTCT